MAELGWLSSREKGWPTVCQSGSRIWKWTVSTQILGKGNTLFDTYICCSFPDIHHHSFFFAAMMYSDFQYRPPPPSYQASMQEYRLRLLLLDRNNASQQQPQQPPQQPPTSVASNPSRPNTTHRNNIGVASPPPLYRSHLRYNFLPNWTMCLCSAGSFLSICSKTQTQGFSPGKLKKTANLRANFEL